MKGISRAQFCIGFFLILAAVPFLSQCGGTSSVYYDGRSCAEGISSGSELYTTLGCSSCHGSITAPQGMPNRDLASFNNAISRVSGMNFLTCLSNEKKAAIISALNP